MGSFSGWINLGDGDADQDFLVSYSSYGLSGDDYWEPVAI